MAVIHNKCQRCKRSSGAVSCIMFRSNVWHVCPKCKEELQSKPASSTLLVFDKGRIVEKGK